MRYFERFTKVGSWCQYVQYRCQLSVAPSSVRIDKNLRYHDFHFPRTFHGRHRSINYWNLGSSKFSKLHHQFLPRLTHTGLNVITRQTAANSAFISFSPAASCWRYCSMHLRSLCRLAVLSFYDSKCVHWYFGSLNRKLRHYPMNALQFVGD